MTDPIANLLKLVPVDNLLFRNININADRETVTVTYVYNRTEYERWAQAKEFAGNADRERLKDLFKDAEAK